MAEKCDCCGKQVRDLYPALAFGLECLVCWSCAGRTCDRCGCDLERPIRLDDNLRVCPECHEEITG